MYFGYPHWVWPAYVRIWIPKFHGCSVSSYPGVTIHTAAAHSHHQLWKSGLINIGWQKAVSLANMVLHILTQCTQGHCQHQKTWAIFTKSSCAGTSRLNTPYSRESNGDTKHQMYSILSSLDQRLGVYIVSASWHAELGWNTPGRYLALGGKFVNYKRRKISVISSGLQNVAGLQITKEQADLQHGK